MSDNETSFSSEEFKVWCQERGITQLTGAPYHPATNGAVECLIQNKPSQNHLSYPPQTEFLILTIVPNIVLAEGSLRELLNSSQIRACIDAQLHSPAHMAHGQKARAATKSQAQGAPEKITFRGYTCYSLCCMWLQTRGG